MFCWLFLIDVDFDVQQNVQVIKDDGLSAYMAELSQRFIYSWSLLSGEKIYQWLAAPDPSRNYNEACEKHQENTGFWFINSPQFAEWKMQPDILFWVCGMHKF